MENAFCATHDHAFDHVADKETEAKHDKCEKSHWDAM